MARGHLDSPPLTSSPIIVMFRQLWSGRYNERLVEVESVSVSDDYKTVDLKIPTIAPTWTIQVAYKLRDPPGAPFARASQGTIHQLARKR